MTPSLPPILRALEYVRRARAVADSQFKTDLHDHLREAEAELEEVAKEAWKEKGEPRCSNCGCVVTDHAVDDEERRECRACECKQFVADK